MTLDATSKNGEPSLARLATYSPAFLAGLEEAVQAAIPAGWPCLYLLHFTVPRHHARHYLGSSLDWEQRLEQHATGRGARITRALWLDGEAWTLAAIFIPRTRSLNIRHLEGRAKRRHQASAYCPLCTRNHISPPATVQYPAPRVSSLDFTGDKACKTPTLRTTAASAKTARMEPPSSQILLPE